MLCLFYCAQYYQIYIHKPTASKFGFPITKYKQVP